MKTAALRDLGAVWTIRLNRHIKWAWLLILLTVLFWAGMLLYWALDRAPPFEVTHYYTPQPVRPGETVRFDMDVKRHLGRECSVWVSRHFRASDGTLRTLGAREFFTVEQLAELDRKSPSKLMRAFPVPTDKFPPGQAALLTNLEYSCNVTQKFWPISMNLVWEFTVLPPK